MKLLVGVIVALVLGFAAYVRLAPLDAQRWHRMAAPQLPAGRYPEAGGLTVATVLSDPSRIDALFAAITDTPRTVQIAGSRDEAMITFVTRTALWGFPDYTTVRVIQQGEETPQWHLQIHGRLRFGRSDLGVNAKRIDGWLMAAGINQP